LAQLDGADLIRANLYGVDLYAANLRWADLTGASIGHTIFAANDLSDVKDLETVRHDGPSVRPSTIGFDMTTTIPENEVRHDNVTTQDSGGR
jgi:pentapeptide repeat protein